jgi:hypothetical protein
MSELSDETVIDALGFPGDVSMAEPTKKLRFVMRNGQRILQQCWERKCWTNGQPTTWKQEWRDIPELTP